LKEGEEEINKEIKRERVKDTHTDFATDNGQSCRR